MKLAEWLKRTGTTQAALAEAIGVSQGRISQIVAGDAPSLEVALRIEKATKGRVKPADLAARENDDMMNPQANSELDSVDDALEATDRRRESHHAGADGLHDPPHLRHHLRADDAGGRPPPQSGTDGGHQ